MRRFDCVLDLECKDVGIEEVWGLYLSIEDSNRYLLGAERPGNTDDKEEKGLSLRNFLVETISNSRRQLILPI